MDTASFAEWIGRSETVVDHAAPAVLARMAATLDRAGAWAPGDPVPELWHWAYCLPCTPQSGLGPDGHALRGGFLPPVPLPRRMWAGSRLEFHRALAAGGPVTRTSTVADVKGKSGKSGDLVFVTVRHEIADAAGVALVEHQDIVYRGLPAAGAPAAAAPAAAEVLPQATWTREVMPSETLLFRYSALTFNTHRIHYDRPYVEQEEGYPGLVVHGPLVATLLVDLVREAHPGRRLARFEFRAQRPLIAGRPFRVCGRAEADGALQLWTVNDQGQMTIQAAAHLA